jgi:hypothetical protein
MDNNETDIGPDGRYLFVVCYGDALFSRRCSCGWFVKPDKIARIFEERGPRATGTCKRCGKISLRFVTWASDCTE